MYYNIIFITMVSLIISAVPINRKSFKNNSSMNSANYASGYSSMQSSITLPYAGSVDYDAGFAFGITNTGHAGCTGIIGSSWGENGIGIHGIGGSNLADATNYGGYFEAKGGKGMAVYGEASYSDWTANYGGYFVTKGKLGSGVYGLATAGRGTGVFGKNEEFDFSGYLGGWMYGVEGRCSQTGPVGILGSRSAGVGGYYTAGGSGNRGFLGGENYGVASYGPLLVHGAGLRVENETGYPIMTIDGPSGWNTDFWGKVVIRSRPSNDIILEMGEGLDYAEGFNVIDNINITPGSVLVIDSENSGYLKISEEQYDRKVAGIVCGGQGTKSGITLGVDKFDHSVALAGRVHCNVDANYGAVSVGDLLTTSPTPGYAMVVKDNIKAQGSILGKTMESLDKGKKGQILVLVTLQ